MEYLGDKLSVAHSQVSGWMGSVRRSIQGAINGVSTSMERRTNGTGAGAEGSGSFKRAASLRSLANRSRESFRRFSLRSQQHLSMRRRTTSLASQSTPSSELVKQCVGQGQEDNKDTDNLVQETDSQYGTWDTGLRTDESLTPATPSSESNLTPSPRKPNTPHTSEQSLLIDTTDGFTISPYKQTEIPFPETPTTLLDTSAQRARAQLRSKSSRRAPPTRAARHSALLTQVPEGSEARSDEWRFRDTTEDKTDSSKPEEDSDSEEQTKGLEARTSSTSSQPQRVALFPGMDPSALKVQLKKREQDSQADGPSPSQHSRSPKSPFMPRAARVLPPVVSREKGEESSPQWLKELKTKKRLSQYENENTA